MLTRIIADLTFEVHDPSRYRRVHTDLDCADHEVWMMYNGKHWYLSVFIGENRHDRAFKSRNEIVSLLTSRRMAI